MHVLVLGSSDNARHIVAGHLERDGFEVSEAPLHDDAVPQRGKERPDLVLLAAGDEEATLVRVCHLIRGQMSVPVIAIVKSNSGMLVVRVLRAGADDVLCQPFSLAELSARILAVLRRASGDADGGRGRYVDQWLSIDLSQRRVEVDGQVIKLSQTELQLLTCLVQRRGRIVGHQEAIDAVWGEGDQDSRIKQLSLYVGYLRRKLEFDPQNPRYIRTVYGRGYWFGSPYDPEPR